MSKKPEIRMGSKKYRPFLQVGLGVAARYGVGRKAALLDVAARNKIPVPPSMVLLHMAYEDALTEGYIDYAGEQTDHLVCRRPERLITALNFPNFNWEFPGPFDLLPVFSGEGGQNQQDEVRGDFAARTDIDPKDTDPFARALCDVWETASRIAPDSPPVARRDVLIRRTIRPTQRGTASTRAGDETDQVALADGQTLELPKLRALFGGGAGLATWEGRLQAVLRSVRRHFSHRKTSTDWQIAWADDGTICYLMDAQPMAELPDPADQALRAGESSEA
jgi:hypothetical protein